METINEFCPVADKPCRHCSAMHIRRGTMACEILTHKEVRVIQLLDLGLWCEDQQQYVANITSCNLTGPITPAKSGRFKKVKISGWKLTGRVTNDREIKVGQATLAGEIV